MGQQYSSIENSKNLVPTDFKSILNFLLYIFLIYKKIYSKS